MAAVASEFPRFDLPSRIRKRGACPDSLSACVALAERISDLPGTVTEDHGTTLPCSIDVYLSMPGGGGRKRKPDLLLCNIGKDGVFLHGLSAWDRHLVALRGWGHLKGQGVLLHLPRDNEELEICWSLLRRAYGLLSDAAAGARPVRAVWQDGLPRFSRTALQ
jgi:hypothetical protein